MVLIQAIKRFLLKMFGRQKAVFKFEHEKYVVDEKKVHHVKFEDGKCHTPRICASTLGDQTGKRY